MKRVSLSFAVLLILLAVLPAAAQPERRARHAGHEPALSLGLTEEQLAQWRAAHEAHREAIEPVLERLHANHDAVEAAIESGDPTTVGEAVLAGHALRGELEAARTALEEAVLEILDEEQEKRYLEHREMRRSFDGPGFGPHLRRRGPAPEGAGAE
jgi:hypothetical protein